MVPTYIIPKYIYIYLICTAELCNLLPYLLRKDEFKAFSCKDLINLFSDGPRRTLCSLVIAYDLPTLPYDDRLPPSNQVSKPSFVLSYVHVTRYGRYVGV